MMFEILGDDHMKCEQAIERIDEELELIEAYTDSVCKVRLDESFYTLKFGDVAEKEFPILRKARGVYTVAQMVFDYGKVKGIGRAMLKQHVEGEVSTDVSLSQAQLKNIFSQLELTVEMLHDRGIVCLDIHEGNFIISPDRSLITCIDLDGAYIYRRGEPVSFSNYKRYDRQDLEELKELMQEYCLRD